MRKLTIEAKSRESAYGFYTALKDFHPELIETKYRQYAVRIAVFPQTDVVAVLNALVDYMTDKGRSPAVVVALDDRRHTLHV